MQNLLPETINNVDNWSKNLEEMLFIDRKKIHCGKILLCSELKIKTSVKFKFKLE